MFIVHYKSTLVANIFWTDAIQNRYICFRPFPSWRYLYPTPRYFLYKSLYLILFILVRHTSQYYRIILITPSSVT
jgi:hypothetical protein